MSIRCAPRGAARLPRPIVTLFLLVACLPAQSALAGPFAFVANFASHDVTVIDAWAGAVVHTLPVAPFPRDVAASPDGSVLYVATDSYVTQIDLRTLDRVDVPYLAGLNQGNGIVVHPNGRTVWVSHQSATFLTQLDVATGRVTSVPLGVFDVRHIAITDAGHWIFGVTQLGAVVQVDTATGGAKTLFTAQFSFPTGIATTSSNEVVVAADGNLTVERFPVTGFGTAGARKTIASGFRPGGVASPTSGDALVARPYDDAVFRTLAQADIALPAGAEPVDVAVHPDSLSHVSVNRGDVTGQAPNGYGSASLFYTTGVWKSLPAGLDPRAATIARRRGEEVMGDPSPLNFAYFQIGSPMRRTIEIVSVGDEEAFVWDVVVVGPDAAAFQIVSNGCRNRSLAYQRRCSVTVEFTAVPKPRPWWARFVRYYVPSYYAELAVDHGLEVDTHLPMRAGAFVNERPELTAHPGATRVGNVRLGG